MSVRNRVPPIVLAVAFLIAACSGEQLHGGASVPPEAAASEKGAASSDGPSVVASPSVLPVPSQRPVLLDPRDAERVAGTWLGTSTLTKVHLSGVGNVGESNGARYVFSQACEHGACDAALRGFDFTDGSIFERTMKYADGAYVYPPQTTTDSGVTCTVGNRTLTEFRASFSGSLRPRGTAADGKGAAELTGTRSFTAVPFGAAAAGCDIAGWTVSVHLVRTAAVPDPVLRETSPELEVLQVFSNDPYPAVPSLNVAVTVRNISNAPVRMGRCSFVVHSAVDGTPLPKRFQPTEPEILLTYPPVLEPGEIGYLFGSNGGFVPTASGGPAIRPWEIGYVSMKITVNDPNVVFPILRFAAKDVIWRARAGQTLGAANAQIEVAGTLVNTSGTSSGAQIVVFFFDGGGALIGSVSGYLSPADAPWEARPFVAQGGGGYPPPELQSRIATAKVIAWSVRPYGPTQSSEFAAPRMPAERTAKAERELAKACPRSRVLAAHGSVVHRTRVGLAVAPR